MRSVVFLFVSLFHLAPVLAQPPFDNANLTNSKYIVSNEDRFGGLDLLAQASNFSIYGTKLEDYTDTCGRTGIISSPKVVVVIPGNLSLDQKTAETIAKQARKLSTKRCPRKMKNFNLNAEVYFERFMFDRRGTLVTDVERTESGVQETAPQSIRSQYKGRRPKNVRYTGRILGSSPSARTVDHLLMKSENQKLLFEEFQQYNVAKPLTLDALSKGLSDEHAALAKEYAVASETRFGPKVFETSGYTVYHPLVQKFQSRSRSNRRSNHNYAYIDQAQNLALCRDRKSSRTSVVLKPSFGGLNEAKALDLHKAVVERIKCPDVSTFTDLYFENIRVKEKGRLAKWDDSEYLREPEFAVAYVREGRYQPAKFSETLGWPSSFEFESEQDTLKLKDLLKNELELKRRKIQAEEQRVARAIANEQARRNLPGNAQAGFIFYTEEVRVLAAGAAHSRPFYEARRANFLMSGRISTVILSYSSAMRSSCPTSVPGGMMTMVYTETSSEGDIKTKEDIRFPRDLSKAIKYLVNADRIPAGGQNADIRSDFNRLAKNHGCQSELMRKVHRNIVDATDTLYFSW